jgi:hypothetical protein
MKPTKVKNQNKTPPMTFPKTRQRKYKPRKYVTTWFRLEFDKHSKPVCAGQVLSELLWIVEQIKKANQTVSKVG